MKKYLGALFGLAGGVLVASSAMAYTGAYVPGAGINGTVHDMSTAHDGMNYVASPADPQTRICIFCHAPHNTYRLSTATGTAGPQADAAFTYLPLWNHEQQANLGYTMYENGPDAPLPPSAKASQAIANGMAPGSVSLLCLSCHDGSVAVNSYGNAAQPSKSQSAGVTPMAASYMIGKDQYLGNHHPIGFVYDDVQSADAEIRTSATLMAGATTIADHLFNTKMECATCHSVHNKGNSGESLLWRSDQNSELCLTCHDKGTYTLP